MIKTLQIKNYALLEDVNIDFEEGFTVVSGETGSGKSIMLDALSLLLGKRVERFSADKIPGKSVIEGVFNVSEAKSSFYKNHDIDFQKCTVVRREIYPEGRSRAFINDTPVLLNVLLDFGSQVIEIHAQYQSILLKDESVQFSLIDQLAETNDLLFNYQKELKKYNQLKEDLGLIQNLGNLSDVELDFFKYQVEELESSYLEIGEKEDIEQQILLLENIEDITHTISESKQSLDNDQGVLSQLSDIRRSLSEFDNFSELHQRVDSVIIELNDISTDFSLLNRDIKSNPEELFKLNNRLDIINKLLQKHKKRSVEELLDYLKVVKDKISVSESFESELNSKQEEIASHYLILQKAALDLNDKRIKVLPVFKREIEMHLKNLGMPFAKFMVELSLCDNYHKFGNTSISFLFSANKGSSLLEMSKVASGGELSRLMLSIKYIAARSLKLNTLVFDEIDSGVSGEIASLMGDMMQEIGKNTQLIAISHLPQIASKADKHLKVVKSVVGNKTISDIVVLEKEERVEEIAKLLSGKELTKAAFDNAKVLLNQ